LGLLRLGIEVPPLKSLIASDTARVYIAGVPLWVLGCIFALAIGSLLLVFPACQPPSSVIFRVGGGQDTYRPNDTLVATPGKFMAITAEPIEHDAILSCKWQYIGETFETIGASRGCEINLQLSGKPGQGVLTLLASQDFCNQSSVFSLDIQIIEP
jgi:hypothetical protein